MKTYQYGSSINDDLLLVNWFLRMRNDGDLEKVFMPSLHTLASFMQNWKELQLMLELDAEGVSAAMWVSQFMGSAIIGLWIRQDRRKHIGTLRAVLRMYKAVFDHGFKSAIGVTKQEEILAEHEKLGYKILGKVPGLYGEWDGYVVVIEAADFYARFDSTDREIPALAGAA